VKINFFIRTISIEINPKNYIALKTFVIFYLLFLKLGYSAITLTLSRPAKVGFKKY